MPIPKDLFDEGIDEFDRELLDFLKETPDQAYSGMELLDAMKLNRDDLAGRARFFQRLGDLERQGFVVERIIHELPYYSLP